jgi:2-polyprenyl-3-methyl-5-hydroxy-6-metoxy-1,4-benzoquinol methylase
MMSANKVHSSDPNIRTSERLNCIHCDSHGLIVYSNLVDHSFAAPGVWNIRRCGNEKCGLLWLDPMPSPDELHRFYKTYYTHQTAKDKTSTAKPTAKKFGHLQNKSRTRGYLANRFGYHCDDLSLWDRFVGLTLWLAPERRTRIDYSIMHLPAVPNGRALDVGCGSGEILSNLQSLGWKVQGVDFDPAAVEAAQARGVIVHQGDLFEQNFPAESFDAIVMSHVIEHVPDPLSLIQECERILKPGGRLVMVTPNPKSLSHFWFGKAWRGLEPPRHLYIQTQASLQSLTSKAGFEHVEMRTSARFAEGMFLRSFEIQRRQLGNTDFTPSLFQRRLFQALAIIEVWLHTFGARNIGEEHVCIGTKAASESVTQQSPPINRAA